MSRYWGTTGGSGIPSVDRMPIDARFRSREVTCPVCNAPIGEWCSTVSGEARVRYTHKPRRALAVRFGLRVERKPEAAVVEPNERHGFDLPPVTFDETNRVKPDGHCQECAKDIPVGRRLCGRCMSKHRT